MPWDPVEAAARNWERHGWDEAAPGMAAITSILRAHRLYQAKVDGILKSYDLNASRYEVLIILLFSKRRALPLGVIGDRLQLNPPTITYIVSRLESTGLVRRAPNPADGRGTLARLTPKGRRTVLKATSIVNELVFEAVGLSDEEITHLNSLLFKLRHKLAPLRSVAHTNGAEP